MLLRLLNEDEVRDISVELRLAHESAVPREHAVDMLMIEHWRCMTSRVARAMVDSVYDYLDDKGAGK